MKGHGRYCSLVCMLLLSVGALQAQTAASRDSSAEPASPADADPLNYYFDKVGGVLWRRCDVGTRASAQGACEGQAIRATWPEAVLLVQELNARKFEGSENWRLPSRRDLRNLLLNAEGIREPIGTNFYLYGFGPADLNALYEEGKEVNFGGRYPGRYSDQCELATAFMMKNFGRPLGVSVDYNSAVSFGSPENHRWLSNNESWSNGARNLPASNNYQNPISINFASKCDYLVAAFFRSDKWFNLTGTLRPHAATPVLVVRGGTPDRSWLEAQPAVGRESEILAQSKKNSAAQTAALMGMVLKVQGYVHDVMSHGGSPAAGAQSGHGSGAKSWLCQVQCRGPLFKLGSRQRLPSVGNSEWDAVENVKDAAHKACIPEPGITWAEVVRCE